MSPAHGQSLSTSHGGAERRTHHNLREIFDQAYRLVSPLLDPNVASSTHFLRVALHEAFPQLHQQDVAILAVSVERVFRERCKPEGQ